MKETKDVLVQTAERLLALEVGGAMLSVEDGIAAASRIHGKLQLHLSPVIGETGFQALFARSVKLIKPSFPSLPELPTSGPIETVMEALYGGMKKQTPPDITEIIIALTVTFIGLLSTFIGEGLTWRLLRKAWPEALPTELTARENP